MANVFEYASVGSPPQVRGKEPRLLSLILHSRITPAGAGKSGNLWVFWNVYRDHPRRCGEKRTGPFLIGRLTGSPPQVRGKARVRAHLQRQRGITPAGAGKRYSLRALCGLTWDHPRRCGEKKRGEPHGGGSPGSPPQVRGKGQTGTQVVRLRRITPAGAGKRGSAIQSFRGA